MCIYLVRKKTFPLIFDCFTFHVVFYYKEESVFQGTKPLVDSIWHSVQDSSGVFSICHSCECHVAH